ncbi:MAG: hypothetical protein D6729_10660 [Deltaproteobacteria bacterium]|nr:MAG: hypothetical protein D6729_10660 [Deltaproteobacteria bacterium]
MRPLTLLLLAVVVPSALGCDGEGAPSPEHAAAEGETGGGRVAASAAGSAKGDEAGGAPAAQTKLPAAPRAGEGEVVYTWYDSRGRPHLATRIEEVPEERRDRVVVSRLGGGLEAAAESELVVGDFRQETPTFSKIDLSKLGATGHLDGAQLLKHHEVYVYSAEWCGFCKKVKAWLRARGIPFIERDIEKDPGAADELRAKALAAGISAGGIPVTDVHGELVRGFAPKALEAALARAGYPVEPETRERGAGGE